MVRWVGSILHGVDPLSYFAFQPVLHDWCNKGRGMCYPVYGMMHIKEPLLVIGKSSLRGGSGFPVSLSEWYLTICLTPYNWGTGRSSEVERSLMVRWVVGSILHGVDPLSYYSFQPMLHDWCNKGRGMCYPVCGMVHIKEPLLLIGKSSPCGGSGFPLSLSEWSFTICPTSYNRK